MFITAYGNYIYFYVNINWKTSDLINLLMPEKWRLEKVWGNCILIGWF